MPTWTWHICDRNGAFVRDITAVALDKTLKMRKSRPCSASFRVPNDAAGSLDGSKTVKVWVDGVLRFVGYLWDWYEDQGAETGITTITAYDVWQLLFHRLVVKPASAAQGFGVWDPPAEPKWVNVDIGVILTEMVDRQFATFGGPPIAGGTFTTSAAVTVTYRQAKVGKAMVDLCDTGLADVWFEGMDRTDGLLHRMHVYGSQGGASGAHFEYGQGALNVESYRRLITRSTLANDISMYGERLSVKARRQDAASQSTWYRQVDAVPAHQIKHKTLLDPLADQQLAIRKQPREVVTFVPVPEIAPQPFTSWFLGDDVTFSASGPNVRQAFSGQMRIHGFTLHHAEDGPAEVSEIQLSSNG